jgi:hypothetical protein
MVEMIRRDVENGGGARLEMGAVLQLVARALDDEHVGRFRRRGRGGTPLALENASATSSSL